MGWFDCCEPRRPVRPVIGRPLEASQLHKGYHAYPNRTGEGLRQWREAEARRKVEEQHKARHRREMRQMQTFQGQANRPERREKQQWAGGVYVVDDEDQYASMQEVEDNERYGPRGRDERYLRSYTPPLDDRWRLAFDQLGRKGANPKSARLLKVTNPTHDPWASEVLSRPEHSRSPPQIHNKPPRILIPENGTVRHAQRSASPAKPSAHWGTDMESSSIMRNAKFKPAPKQGKRVLYNEDAATATRRNVGF